MPSYSTNLNLAKPTVGGDTNQWGGYLNTNTDTLDGIFNAAGTGTSVGLQVGSGKTLKVGGTLTATGSSSFSGTVSLSSTVQLTGNQNLLKFYEGEGGGDNYVGIMAPQQMTGNNDYSLVLPAGIGTAGQFLKLTSLSGSIGLLQFDDAAGTTINNNADNRVITGSGTANTLEGEANLTFDGNNLGVGITTPDTSSYFDKVIHVAGGSNAGIMFNRTNSTTAKWSIGCNSSANLDFVKESAVKMSIDSSGRLSFGEDAVSTPRLHYPNNDPQFVTKVGSTSNRTAFLFNNPNGTVGDIATSGSSTSYNTSSDYRLKENEVAISDGIERLKQLKPYKFNFKTEPDTIVDGFFAHEVTPVVPEAISGDKDAMAKVYYQEDDEIPNGKQVGDFKEYSTTEIQPQAIDQSKLVPLITAALQEAITKIESLESEIDQLKGVN